MPPDIAPSLRRTIGIPGALLLTLSAVTPASSVFVILPGALRLAGTGALAAMLAAAIIGIGMAFVYAELSSAFPFTGGEYVFVAKTVGPLPGFVLLGLTVVGAVLSPAVFALGAAQFLALFLPGIDLQRVAAIIVAGATVLGVLNIRSNAWLTGSFLLVETVALLILCYFGFTQASRPIATLIAHPVMTDAGRLVPSTLAAIGSATSLALFAYNGYGGAVYFGEEMRDAPKRMARTIIWALGVGVATELVPMIAVLLGAPDLATLFGSDTPFNDFLVARAGVAINVAVSAGVALAMINATIVLMLTNARLLYSTGRDRVWSTGLNNVLSLIHPRLDSPWAATLLAGAVSLPTCWLDINLLLIFTGTSLVAIYGGICIAAVAGRRGGTTAHGDYRMPLFPIAPLFCLVVLCGIAYASWMDVDFGRPSLIANAAIMALAAIYYFRVLKPRGAWVVRTPGGGPTVP